MRRTRNSRGDGTCGQHRRSSAEDDGHSDGVCSSRRLLSMIRLLSVVSLPSMSNAGRGSDQAHLPLSSRLPGAPAVANPNDIVFGGSRAVEYPFKAIMGGSPLSAISSAVNDLPYAMPQPFAEWDINHIKHGETTLECPQGFVLSQKATCILVEFSEAEESCPYASMRRGQKCIQVDSVGVERTCPSGFEYFMRGCIRRTQITPLMACPAGYVQRLDSCLSVSLVSPDVKCPNQYYFRDDYCHRDIIKPPSFRCTDPSSLLLPYSLVNTTIVPPSSGVPSLTGHPSSETWVVSKETPKCSSFQIDEPTYTCPALYALVTQNTNLVSVPEDLRSRLNQQVADATFPSCLRLVDLYGHVSCPQGTSLVWNVTLASSSDPFGGARCRRQTSVASDAGAGSLTDSGISLMPSVGNLNFQDFSSKDLKTPGSIPTNTRFFNSLQKSVNELMNIELYSEPENTPPPLRKGRRRNRPFPGDNRPAQRRLSNEDSSILDPETVAVLREFVSNRNRKRELHEVDQDEFSLPLTSFEAQGCNEVDVSSYTWVAEPYPTLAPGLDDLSIKMGAFNEQFARRVTGGFDAKVPVCRQVEVIPAIPVCPRGGRMRCASRKEVTTDPVAMSSDPDYSGSEIDAEVPDEDQFGTTNGIDSGGVSGGGGISECVYGVVCEVSATLIPSEAYCEDAHAVLTTRVSRDDGDVQVNVQVCVTESDIKSAILECPFGVMKVATSLSSQLGIRKSSVGDFDDKQDLEEGQELLTLEEQTAVTSCETLIAEPVSIQCPEGYTRATQDLGTKNSMKSYKKSIQPVIETASLPSVCELLEYADYQINCPLGYKRDRAKNTPTTCVTEKIIQPSVICPPGFLASTDNPQILDPKACIKTVEVAPTVLTHMPTMLQGAVLSSDQPSVTNSRLAMLASPSTAASATACVLTKDKKLSCGVERKYHGAVDYENQLQFGRKFHEKLIAKNQ